MDPVCELLQDGPPGLEIEPRIVIHGGGGNITPSNLTPDLRAAYANALKTVLEKTSHYMSTRIPTTQNRFRCKMALPSALDTATYAVTLLEDCELFNAGRGAVFTRDGVNELEASVMVSRGKAKRGVGVTGLRTVRNPVLLARALLEHGDKDLAPHFSGNPAPARGSAPRPPGPSSCPPGPSSRPGAIDVPSAQGHTLLSGAAAEALAARYGLALAPRSYFFTQRRWDEHVRGLDREREGRGAATWSADEYLPQGTVGAVALDANGVVCCATSTGGLTNKLTGRVGDSPVVGAGFWAEEWELAADSGHSGVGLGESLTRLLAACLGTPQAPHGATTVTRSLAVSGTGNGDSFARLCASRTAAAIGRFGSVSSAEAVSEVAGPGGELQRSAGGRWGHTGEGEGGMIGIEVDVWRDDQGRIVRAGSRIVGDYNCNGMFRAWIDWGGKHRVRIWRRDEILDKWSIDLLPAH